MELSPKARAFRRTIGTVRGPRARWLMTSVTAVAWLASGGWALRAHAAERVGPLQRCMTAALSGTPGVDSKAARSVFLLTGDTKIFTHAFAKRQCVGFLAAGTRYVQALELEIKAADGHVVARSRAPSTLAYTSYCGRANERVFATVRVTDGQGEVVYQPLSRVLDRPRALTAIAQCKALGSVRPQPVDVGPEPPGQSIAQQLRLARARLRALGYRGGRLVAYGTLQAGEHEAHGVVLEDDRCYALVAVGSRDVRDLDLRVFGPQLPLASAGADTTRRRSADVRLCTQAPARYVIDIASFRGSGVYAVQAYELDEPPNPPGVSGQARIGYAQSVSRMHAHGMRATVLTTGIAGADEVFGYPLELAPNHCYAVAAVDASDVEDAAPLQLGLLSAHGELLRLAAGLEGVPLLYHCTHSSQRVRLAVRSSQNHGSARFVLVLGSDGPPAEVTQR